MKAPRVGGFPVVFNQKNWEIVKDSLFEIVRGCFDGSHDIASIKKTLVCLIPHVDKPELLEIAYIQKKGELSD